MTYLLDTMIVSDFVRTDAQHRTPRLFEFVERVRAEEGPAIAFITQYELVRGHEELRLRPGRAAEGARKLSAILKLIDETTVLGLDDAGGRGWMVAASLWARARALKPALVFKESDLLI